MKHHRLFAAACCAGISTSILCSTAFADINLNGFATFAGGQTLSSAETLYGYEDKMDFANDSLLGLQINSDLGDRLDVTAQIISRGEQGWDAEFEWAYVGYQATDSLKFILGRQRSPYYVYSDYLDVSYAYHWITPPEAVYNLPFDTVDGIGMLYTRAIGPVDSTLHFVFGGVKGDIGEGNAYSPVEINNQLSLAWNLTWDWVSLRLGYAESKAKIQIDQFEMLANAWRTAGPAFGLTDFADSISGIDENPASFSEVGITIDYNNFLAVAEYTVMDIDDTALLDKGKRYFASFGYRFGSFMPHLTVGATDDTPSDYSALNAVPDGVDSDLDALKAGTIAAFEASRSETEFHIIGARWDFHPSAALKVEYESNTDKLNDETVDLVRFAIVTVF